MSAKKLGILVSCCVAGSVNGVATANAQASPVSAQAQTASDHAAAKAVEAGPTTDANQLQEIIVTATKIGETNLQRTPIAASAFSGAALERSVTNDVHDLAKLVPNVTVSQSSDNAEIYIRGIGSSNVYNGSDPDATVQIDGVYIARPYSQFADFLDAQRIEVLRGPQGTLYGRNAIAGTINIISKTPSNTLDGVAQVLVGNYGTVQAKGYLSGPLIKDKLEASISATYTRHDPYEQNIDPVGTGASSANRGGLRAQLRAMPAPGLTMTTRFDYSKDLSRPNGIIVLLSPVDASTNSILGNYHKVDLNTPDRGKVTAAGISEDISYNISNHLNLKSITAYRRNTNFVDVDADASDANKQEFFTTESEQQLSEEINLSGHFGALSGVAGLYYFKEDISTVQHISIFGPGQIRNFYPVTHDQSYAAFAQFTYQLPFNLSLVAGARYTKENKDFSQLFYLSSVATGAALSPPVTFALPGRYHSVTPKFGLNWTPASNLLLYFSATKGFKSGGFNALSTLASSAAFGPESLWSYEVGEKGEFFNKTLRLNLTAFKYDYADLQVQETAGPGNVVITNAANARITGIELESVWLPAKWVEFGTNTALLNAKYLSYPNASFTGGLTGDASGNILNNAPKFSTNDYVEYHLDLNTGSQLNFAANYNYKSRIQYDSSNRIALTQGGYSLINLNAGWRSSSRLWEAEVYVKNVANRQYLTLISSQSGGILQGVPGDPRTFGVRFSHNF
jgi:iron complex outermembrane receptor protein